MNKATMKDERTPYYFINNEYFCKSKVYAMKIDSIEDIKEQIAQTENEQVEFKETTGQLERGMETL
jgi:hypothetical protein